ncbi:hypothetical protein [Halorussus sp. MSC15.2]|uniref:hypothetical protein n=1 Tax=Halorussus sp. MSC15.2 TaxID=2283638 RepID=UPI0013D0BA80|nr:hypothetical protein [Halorussus sp. MSC15.2]NEU55610.1 hypothetical protein [Halorussus sp. MSC15.2]
MPSDIPDEQLERVVRRAVRAELDLLAGRVLWTLLSVVGISVGVGLVSMGLDAAKWNFGTVVFTVLGIWLVGLGIRTLLLKWDLPPYYSENGLS